MKLVRGPWALAALAMTIVASLSTFARSEEGQPAVAPAPSSESSEKETSIFERYRPIFRSGAGVTSLGMYGEVIYNNELEGDGRDEINLERAVLYVAHEFNDWISAYTEFEVEDADEFEVEQAFLEFRPLDTLTLKGGLILIPASHTNLYHEPTYFYSVERPDVDRFLVPSTWRELGLSVAGNPLDWLSYELVVTNSLALATEGGESRVADIDSEGIRGMRQGGTEATFNDVAVGGRVTVQPTLGLSLAASFFTGETGQSQKIQTDDEVVKLPGGRVTLLEADARYERGGLDLRAEYATALMADSAELSTIFGQTLAEQEQGFHVEAAYDVLGLVTESEQRVMAFYRYSWLDLQSEIAAGLERNPASEYHVHTLGLAWFPIPQVVAKLDVELPDDDANERPERLNMGLGFSF